MNRRGGADLRASSGQLQGVREADDVESALVGRAAFSRTEAAIEAGGQAARVDRCLEQIDVEGLVGDDDEGPLVVAARG